MREDLSERCEALVIATLVEVSALSRAHTRGTRRSLEAPRPGCRAGPFFLSFTEDVVRGVPTSRCDIAPTLASPPRPDGRYSPVSRRGWLIYVAANLRRPLIIVRADLLQLSLSLVLFVLLLLLPSSLFLLCLSLPPSDSHLLFLSRIPPGGLAIVLVARVEILPDGFKTKYARLSLHHRRLRARRTVTIACRMRPNCQRCRGFSPRCATKLCMTDDITRAIVKPETNLRETHVRVCGGI